MSRERTAGLPSCTIDELMAVDDCGREDEGLEGSEDLFETCEGRDVFEETLALFIGRVSMSCVRRSNFLLRAAADDSCIRLLSSERGLPTVKRPTTLAISFIGPMGLAAEVVRMNSSALEFSGSARIGKKTSRIHIPYIMRLRSEVKENST